jgi:hypothetical protein
MLHLSLDDSSHLINVIQGLHPKADTGQSDGQGSFGNWGSSHNQICASESSCKNIKNDVLNFSEFIEFSVSHFQGSEDSSEMHGEVGDFGKEEAHQSGSGIIHHFTRDDTDQGKEVMYDEAGISKTIINAGKEIIEEIRSRGQQDDVLNFAGRLGVFGVVSVDVVAGNKEGKETVDDRDDTIFNVVDFLFAEFGRKLELVVDEGVKDEPGNSGTAEEDEFVFEGFEFHLDARRVV